MKEIKAYVRPCCLEIITRQLEEAGAKDLTVIRVDVLGALVDYEKERWHFVRKYAEKYSAASKLEIICRDEQVQKFVDIIAEAAHMGEPGDGRIFVTNVEQAVNIRNKEKGEKAL